MHVAVVVLLIISWLHAVAATTNKDADDDGPKSFLISRCCAIYALGAAGTTAVGAVVMLPASLGLFGFGAAGPVAGTVAAAWQSSLGGAVLGGSLFATLQGIAMAGIGGTATLGAGVAGAVGVVQFCNKLEDLGLCDPATIIMSRL